MDVPTANTEDHALIDSDLTKMMKEAEGIQKEAAEISADLFSGARLASNSNLDPALRLAGELASHGCIRMPYWKARQFYDAVRIGTPVVVRP